MPAMFKRFVQASLVLLLAACAAHGQNTGPAQPGVSLDFSKDPCGNPMMESMLWVDIQGTVSRIVNGNTILLTLDDDHRVIRVHLAGIAPALRKQFETKARQRLKAALLNKRAEVMVNPDRWLDKRPGNVTGVLHLKVGPNSDVALVLLAEGLARFEKPKPYTISHYTACQYRLTEAEAHLKRVGVWQ